MADEQAKRAAADAKAAAARAKALRPWWRKKRTWVGGLVVLVVVIVAVSSGGGGKGGTSTGGSAAGTPSAAAAATSSTSGPGIGQVAKDGDFAFVVQSFTCGDGPAQQVNPDGAGEQVPAGAQECMATIKVTDDKTSSQTFFDDDQYAYDAAGKRFSADTNGVIYVDQANDGTQVNPGVSVVALVPFQVPASDAVTMLELHDSAFSGGVKVRVAA